MKRKESLEREHDARVGRTRVGSALPPLAPRRRGGLGWMVLGAILLLLLAGVAGWLVYGR